MSGPCKHPKRSTNECIYGPGINDCPDGPWDICKYGGRYVSLEDAKKRLEDADIAIHAALRALVVLSESR